MVRGIGGMHRGLVMAALLSAGLAEVVRRPVDVADRELEPRDYEPEAPQKLERSIAAPVTPSAKDERALSAAEQKRARKNARRLSVTEAA